MPRQRQTRLQPPAADGPNSGAAAGAPDLAARVELRPGPAGDRKANAIPLIARLLRAVRDRDRAARAAEHGAKAG